MIFVSDHGGDGFGHGDSSNPHINKTLLIVDHPTINFNTNYVKIPDIVPTIFTFMGIKSSYFDCYTDGNSIIL